MDTPARTPASEPAPPFTILVALCADSEEHPDPALIQTVGQEAMTLLCQEGLTLRPVPTGQQGGPLLFQLLAASLQWVWEHRMTLEEVLNDASALLTLASALWTVATRVRERYARHVGQAQRQVHPITVTLQLGDMTRSLDGADVAQVQLVLTDLVRTQRARQPAILGDGGLQVTLTLRLPRKRGGIARRHTP
ncbi:MAG: hypothetical protein IMW90_21605 [Thermogemmatispora sp.]|uniref:hypothetical protein n=2 Tax=Thermogemmatispora TaxID=768669 RepID=UPI001A074EF6|nr:hypothetical protein [Thermogemmatispora sp.]MBE3568323.1 hypothetical protein [Thermogemmatispora sp.]